MRNKPRTVLTVEEYNEPVVFCKSCHSLHIVSDETIATEDWDGSHCAKCGSTDIGECAFGQWLEETEAMEERQRRREWER